MAILEYYARFIQKVEASLILVLGEWEESETGLKESPEPCGNRFRIGVQLSADNPPPNCRRNLPAGRDPDQPQRLLLNLPFFFRGVG